MLLFFFVIKLAFFFRCSCFCGFVVVDDVVVVVDVIVVLAAHGTRWLWKKSISPPHPAATAADRHRRLPIITFTLRDGTRSLRTGTGPGPDRGRKLPHSPPPAVHDNSKEDAAVDAAAGVVDGDNQSHIRFAYSAFAFFMYVGASPPHARNLLTN